MTESTHLIPLVVCLATAHAMAAPATFDFEGRLPDDLEIVQFASLETAEPLTGTGSLRIDTRRSDGEWNPCVRSAAGLLKPGVGYSVTIDFRVLEQADDSYLLLLIRPLSVGSHTSDLAAVRVDKGDRRGNRKIRFEVPAGITDYSVQIHTRKQVLALIDEIQIAEGSGMKFYPAAANTGQAAPAKLPTGSEPFTVDLPRNTGGKTVSAVDCGMSPDSADNAKALQDAINQCRTSGAAKLVVPQGTYRLTSESPITFEGLKDFVFDGQGSTFVYYKQRGDMFHVRQCGRVELMNFNADWDWDKDPLGSVVKVEAGSSGHVDLRFVDYREFPRRDVRIGILEELDPETLSVGCEDSVDIGFEFFRGRGDEPRIEWLSGNRLRLFPQNDWQAGQLKDHVTVEKLFRIRHYVYDMNAVVMSDNIHLTLRNINIYSCPGHAFVSSGQQHHWQFLGVNIIRPPGTQRPITCTADHHHITHSQGYLLMDGCEFSLGGDDCLNVHDCSGFASTVDEHTVRSKNMRSKWMYTIGDPVELRHDDYSPTGFTGTIKSIRTIDDSKGIHEFTFNETLPRQTGDGFVLFNWRFNSHNVIIRNGYFHDNRARGLLLLGRNITVENNRFFHNQMGGIKIETGYTFDVWSEGYGASNIVIRRNLFDTINPMGQYPREMHPVIYMSAYLRTDPSEEKTTYPILKDILVEDNEFRDNPGVIAYVCCAANVTIRNNTIINNKPRRKPFPHRGAIGAAYCSDLYVSENTWMDSPQVKSPGIFADEDTTRNIHCTGNRIVLP